MVSAGIRSIATDTSATVVITVSWRAPATVWSINVWYATAEERITVLSAMCTVIKSKSEDLLF